MDLGPCGADNFKRKKCKSGGKKAKAKGACFHCGKQRNFARDCTEPNKVLLNFIFVLIALYLVK